MEKYLFKADIYAELSEIVEANSEKEALRKIKNHDYDDVELVDDEMNLDSIDKCDIEED